MDPEADSVSEKLPSLSKYQETNNLNIRDSGYDTNTFGSSIFSECEKNIGKLSINDEQDVRDKLVPIPILEDEKKQDCENKEYENLVKAAFTPDQDGDTYLHIALAKGSLLHAESLIQMCPDSRFLDIQNNTGQAPIHVAACLDDVEGITMLIRSNVRMDLVDEKGMNILHLCAELGHVKSLQAIVKVCNEENRKDALLSIVNERDFSGVTPFYIAVSKNNKDICEFLTLELPVDVNAVDLKTGNSPLHEATMLENNAEIVYYLLSTCRADVNQKSFQSVTPLHIAAAKGNEATCAFLLEYGASRDIADVNGHIPAVYASSERLFLRLKAGL